MVQAVALVREFERRARHPMGAPLFGNFTEVWPGEDVQTPEEIDTFVRDEAWGYHASCSAKIGGDDDPNAPRT